MDLSDVGLDTLTAEMATTDPEGESEPPSSFDVKSLAGITAPLGFFDPLGFTDGASEGRIRFYREVEIKHSRVAMLASLGFVVGEPFHPLFGGEIDVPSYIAFQATPLQTFWPAVLLVIGAVEITTSALPNFKLLDEGWWELKADYQPGENGFDPLGLKPTDEAEL